MLTKVDDRECLKRILTIEADAKILDLNVIDKIEIKLECNHEKYSIF